MIVDPDLPRHRKTLKLAARLGLGRSDVVLLLIDMWGHCQTRRDDFLGSDAEDVAACCQCLEISPKKLHAALLGVGWIDEVERGYIAHGWLERNKEWFGRSSGGKLRAQGPRDAKGRLLGKNVQPAGTVPPATIQLAGDHSNHVVGESSPPTIQLACSHTIQLAGLEESRVDKKTPVVPLQGTASEDCGLRKPEPDALTPLVETAIHHLTALFGRKKKWVGHGTRCELEEMAKNGVLEIAEADWAVLARFYAVRGEFPGEKMWRNTVEAVAQNLPGEIEKAKAWLAEHEPDFAAKKSDAALSDPVPHRWQEWLSVAGYPDDTAWAQADGAVRREFRRWRDSIEGRKAA